MVMLFLLLLSGNFPFIDFWWLTSIDPASPAKAPSSGKSAEPSPLIISGPREGFSVRFGSFVDISLTEVEKITIFLDMSYVTSD